MERGAPDPVFSRELYECPAPGPVSRALRKKLQSFGPARQRECVLFKKKKRCLYACVSLVCILDVHCGAHVPWNAYGVGTQIQILVFVFPSCECCCYYQASWADSIRVLFCRCLQSCCKNAGIIGVCYHVWLLVGSRNSNSGLHAFRATLFSTDHLLNPL